MDVKTLLKGATIFPITSNPFKGDILISNGKIEKIGENIQDPNAEIVDLTGKFLFPGFVDAHSHIGLFEEGVGYYYSDGNEATDPVTPHVKALDGFNPQDPAIERALAGGVTTVMIVPGSANPIGGQGSVVKFKSIIVEECVVKDPAGLKMAFGENPKRVYGERKQQTPSTRMGTAGVIRDYFIKVKNYMKKKEIAEKEGKEFTETDLKMEIGELVLRKKIPARIHAHRADDILTAIRIAEEFGFNLVIEHGTEAYKISKILAEKNIPVVVGPLLTFRTKLELKDLTMEVIAKLVEAGVMIALMCDHPVIPLEYATVQAATAMRYGAREEDLLKILTINPAKILGLDNTIGSIEEGKDADLVVWSDHPFNMKSKVERVFIEGMEVFRR
ncbi:amidohydrolase [Thermotoga sp. KOL6]|uniref:amidohydrolase n=1 Tax=Thermotoga sp. KOL6 TaxID=126741 RepID=UPI000C765902|nr:amidohydrolase [Thermotoga sp. KOL6]PLV60107.1 amidohydrolase [Thermotoga sp. KOL6]